MAVRTVWSVSWAQRGEAGFGDPRRLGGTAEHRERVREGDVGAMQRLRIAELLRALERPCELRHPFLTSSQVGQAHAEHLDRSQLSIVRTDRSREAEGLFGERERLVVAPQQVRRGRKLGQ